jgi:hypothetical protein
VRVEEVRASSFCGDAAGPSARFIGTAEALREALAAEGLVGGVPPAPIDFGRDAVVLVSLGERPTAGHAVGLAAPTAPVRDGIAEVTVRTEEPAPEAIVAQG